MNSGQIGSRRSYGSFKGFVYQSFWVKSIWADIRQALGLAAAHALSCRFVLGMSHVPLRDDDP